MNFKKLDNGMYEGFALLKKIEKKTSARGSVYLDLTLADQSGEISAKKWDYVDGFQQDSMVKVRGELEVYNGKDQFKVIQMRPVNDGDGIRLDDLVPSSPYGGALLFQMLEEIVSRFQDQDFKKIVLESLRRNKENLLFYPAAFRLHHAVRGGLLFHTVSIVRMAQALAKIYINIDEELLISGAILHDEAKTWELDVADTGLAKGYTVGGDLIGHLVKGAIDIELIAADTGADKEKALLLQHMVISHHGEPEYGAAVRPMFLEAEILSQLDRLDATIFEINHATSKVQPGAFTDRQWALDNRKLYNHGRKSTEHLVKLEEGTKEQ